MLSGFAARFAATAPRPRLGSGARSADGSCCAGGSAPKLARGPAKLSSAQQVDVKMPDGLPGVLALIDHQTVSRLGHAKLFRDCFGGVQQMLVVARRWQIGYAPHLFSGHNQDVDRSLRVQVSERHHVFVFVDDVRRDFAVDDPGEERRHDPSKLTP